MNILDNCKEVKSLYSDRMRERVLIQNPETSERFVRHTIKSGTTDIYKRLAGKSHDNIIGIIHICDSDNIIVEEYFDAVPLNKIINNGISRDDFMDIVLQICDGLEFLSTQNPPIAYNNIAPENIMIDEDGLIKLTNFEKASEDRDIAQDLETFASLINSVEEKFIKRYRKVIDNCRRTGHYKNYDALRQDIVRGARTYWGIPVVTIVLIVLFMRFLRVFPHLSNIATQIIEYLQKLW